VPLRRALENVDPYRPQPPASVLAERLGLERLVKLASNEGAFGPLSAARAALDTVAGELNRYPDGGAAALRDELGAIHGVPATQVVVGNGADELIRLCGAATLDAGDTAVVPWPSFPSYLSAAAVHGARAHRVPLRSHAPDLDALLAAAPGARLVYLANPNNPTGSLLEAADVRRFVDSLPESTLLVLDEAYAEYADPEPAGPALVREGRPRLCVLRTFSKVYGLAALRVGYALASPEVADALDRVRPIFNVNAAAQAAALASLSSAREVGERVAHARRARERLGAALAEAGLAPAPTQANFVFAETPDGDGDAMADRLLRAGFIVRALRGFGAPGAIRVTCGSDEENEAFIQALSRLVEHQA
jgi:histidinol-phosphate aminotransferase